MEQYILYSYIIYIQFLSNIYITFVFWQMDRNFMERAFGAIFYSKYISYANGRIGKLYWFTFIFDFKTFYCWFIHLQTVEMGNCSKSHFKLCKLFYSIRKVKTTIIIKLRFKFNQKLHLNFPPILNFPGKFSPQHILKKHFISI